MRLPTFHAVSDDNHLQLCALQVSPPTLRRQAGAGGLGSEDDDVLSRRRTISGPEGLPGGQSDVLLQEPVQPRPEPRPRSTVVSSSEITDGTATLRRKRLPEGESQAPTSATTTVVTMTTGSDTIRRRTRTSEHTEKDVYSNNQAESTSSPSDNVKKHGGELQQNGVVLRRRPVSEVTDRTETNKETCEWMEARKSLKPPVSPKPVTLRKSQADPPTPTRRVPIPGPESTEPAQSPGEKLPYPDIFTHKLRIQK